MGDLSESQAIVGNVAEIWRYPVKSMLGERLQRVQVSDRGLLGDRTYAMIDRETGKVASAKNPRIWPNLFSFHSAFRDNPSPSGLLPAVTITLPDGNTTSTDAPDVEARLSEAVGRPVRLARSNEEKDGASGEGYWPDHEWLVERDSTFDVEYVPGTFFDGAMCHLVATSTLAYLGSLAPASQFDVRRFRPNLLIQTTGEAIGFVEDEWMGKTIALGEVLLRIDRGCPRCVMTTLPVAELPKDPTILRTAVQKHEGNVGVYATVLRGGQIELGAPVRLA